MLLISFFLSPDIEDVEKNMPGFLKVSISTKTSTLIVMFC